MKTKGKELETGSKTKEVQLSEFSVRNWDEMKDLLDGAEGYAWKKFVLSYEKRLKPKRWEFIHVTSAEKPNVPPLVEIKSVILPVVLVITVVVSIVLASYFYYR